LEGVIMKATLRNRGGCNALIAVWLDHRCPNAREFDARRGS
jgi:hypothetical protein